MPDFLTVRSACLAFGLALVVVFAPRVAGAHEFVVELRGVGTERDAIVSDALRGFLLATVERDGHANEESNGHLGGLDVYIIPRPARVAAGFPQLKQPPGARPDIVAVMGPSDDVADEVELIGVQGVVVRTGVLHRDNRWTMDPAQDPDAFAARYVREFGQPPGEWAARGYNLARRIEAAIRPLGGVNDRVALARAFADSAEGIRW